MFTKSWHQERGASHQSGLFAVIIRSIVFNALFYLNLIVLMLAITPTMVMPRGAIVRYARPLR